MARIIIGPGKYIQGENELKRIGIYTKEFGKSYFILVSKSGLNRVRDIVNDAFKDSGAELIFEVFSGECSRNEINRLRKILGEKGTDAVIGIGGGKIIDTVKAVACYEKKPVVVVPTIASTDAPCSALSIIYTDDGIFSEILHLPRNPDIVLVDTTVISNAPVRLLISGMGDALSTYFEARACLRSNSSNMGGGKQTKAAMALAELCYETLLKDGLKAKIAAENKTVTKALENIVEANTYLSGTGFESGGLAAAHSIHNGFTVLNESRSLYHGEKVAFGTIVQLILENSPRKELEEVLDFCIEIGLPVSLEELGMKEIGREEIFRVAEAACAEGETIYNMPFEIRAEEVYSSIVTADAFGRLRKRIILSKQNK